MGFPTSQNRVLQTKNPLTFVTEKEHFGFDFLLSSLHFFLTGWPKTLKVCKKYGTLHEFACHPCAGGHANLLCIVPILIYVLPKQAHNALEPRLWIIQKFLPWLWLMVFSISYWFEISARIQVWNLLASARITIDTYPRSIQLLQTLPRIVS